MGGVRMKIRMLVDGHTTQVYDLDRAKTLLKREQSRGNLVVDDETRQLAKVDFLKEDSSVTVYPVVKGG